MRVGAEDEPAGPPGDEERYMAAKAEAEAAVAAAEAATAAAWEAYNQSMYGAYDASQYWGTEGECCGR